ncbi:helix-turn-helix domain-containing protein [Halovivax gelatinilyticus]|uniref:helix-turn-helix domain-containing protein n=1 Tax=Halovivax gelatinilyticus TaxID=2961597 RepID=UPI0020CA3810|nr:helix-turn-helix domain-containing protein [Halovivax gelatinilyticus]
MSVIAEIAVPADALALAALFEADGDATLQVERLASHSRKWVMPAVWLSASDVRSAADLIEADSAVEAVELVDVEGPNAFALVQWGAEIQRLVDAVLDRHGVVVEASAAGGTWYLKLKFVERTALTDFQAYTSERDLSVDLRRLADATAAPDEAYDLTAEQRETLLLAHRMGYFDVPREAQIEDLAAALDISTNSVSERLRRATKALTENTIGDQAGRRA